MKQCSQLLIGIALTLSAMSWPMPAGVRSAGVQQAQGLELVGQHAVGGVMLADVWAHGSFVYLGTRGAGTGVKIVDASNPTNPQLIATLATNAASSYEDVVAIEANTANFRGTLLAAGLQPLGAAGARGVQFWDVTNPRQPRPLGFLETGAATGGVHELSLFQRGDRIFALLAVPGSEAAGAGGDFRIVEATDPRHPRQLADWGVQAHLGLRLSGNIFCHSAAPSPDGRLAYLSYWDAGFILLDISEPTNPRYLGRTHYAPDEEGNAHSVWPANNGNLLLAADEDFNPGGIRLEITEPLPLAGLLQVAEGSLGPQLCGSNQLSGALAYIGRGCVGDTLLSSPSGKIALIDRGTCTFRDKILRAQQAGAIAALIVNNVPGNPIAPGGDGVGITIPSAMISLDDGDRLKAALAGGQSVRATFLGDPNATWGFLRIFDISEPTRPQQIGLFATENTRRCPAPDSGWYTIHNPFVIGDTAYVAWYSDGVRVLDIADPTNPREIGFFVPPDRTDGRGLQGGKSLVWGVYVQNNLIFISDINTGLYILRRRS